MKSRIYHVSGSAEEVQVTVPLDGKSSFKMNGDELEFTVESLGKTRYLVRGSQGQIWTVDLDKGGKETLVESNGSMLRLTVLSERDKLLGGGSKAGGASSGDVSVSMPGKIVKVMVEEGTQVNEGDAILIAEAMKMENVMRAVSDGVVTVLHAAAGDSLAVDQKIIEFE